MSRRARCRAATSRWRCAGRLPACKAGSARGGPIGRELLPMAVSHYRLRGGRIVEDVTVFDEVAALVAGLYDGRVGRLWRSSAGEPPAREPFVAGPFDPDLRQERGRVYPRAEDQPEMPDGAPDAGLAAGHAVIDVPDVHRARAFVLRAHRARTPRP